MWAVGKAFFVNYALLCVLSLIALGHPWLQRLLVVGWIVQTVRICERARRNGVPLHRVMSLALASQFPGVILILCSLWTLATTGSTELESGMMEVWYHPFIPLLELLPAGTIRNWSDLYLETCLIPAGTLVICFACCVVTGIARPAKG